jgi:hypothetical protein
VAGLCEYDNEPSGSSATELVICLRIKLCIVVIRVKKKLVGYLLTVQCASKVPLS